MRILLLFLVLFGIQLYGQTKLFYDLEGRKCDSSNATYYRIGQKLNDTLQSISGYYIKNDELQFLGQAYDLESPLTLEGEAKWYDDEGVLRISSYYKKGKLHGVYKDFYSKGTLRSEKHYEDSLENGTYISYYENGAKYFSINMKFGEVCGSYSYWNGNENIVSKGSILNGARDGECSEYFKNGKLNKSYNFSDRLLSEKYIELDEYGDTVRFGSFHEGKPVQFTLKENHNNHEYKGEMTLKDGIENWVFTRENKMVLEAYYNEGQAWKMDILRTQ